MTHISLYARSGQTNTPFGTLDVPSHTFSRTFTGSGNFCIGTNDIPNHECFAYIEGPLDDYTVQAFVDANEDIVRLSLVQNSDVLVSPIGESATPNWNASIKPEKKKKVVEIDEEGNEVEKEVEEDQRTWLQRNWMYVVLPLVFVMLSSEK